MLWLRAFHIIAMVCWFAGIFYLPRLFVYHAAAKDSVSCERFKLMERRLYYGIMAPSALVTVFLGIWLLSYNYTGYLQSGWMQLKLLLVFLLLGFHGLCGKYRRDFFHDRNQHSQRFYRIYNEIPVIFLVGIILLVVIKPF